MTTPALTDLNVNQLAAHTPGPWLIEARPYIWGMYPATTYDVVAEEVRGDDDYSAHNYEFQTGIASIHNADVEGSYKGIQGAGPQLRGEYPCSNEAEANARLIAAAPDLLAVVRDFMENPLFQVAVGGSPNMVDAFMERARAAIAKATQS